MKDHLENVFSLHSTKEIPPEILLAIFRLALLPSWKMTPGTSAPPFPYPVWSVDISRKRSLLEVCKTWYSAGLEFLYENVVLAEIGQILVFVDTLKARPEFGTLVHSINICYRVFRGYRNVHDEAVDQIFKFCPRVTHFVFHPHDYLRATLPTVGLSITTLDLGDCVPYDVALGALTQLCETLESLSVALPWRKEINHPLLTFVHLANLRLCVGMQCEFPARYWTLPCLQRLSLRHNRALGSLPPDLELVSDVLKVCGATLKRLRISDILHSVMCRLTLQDVLSQCPVLEHLGATEAQLESGSQKTLRWLDIFGSRDELPAPDAECLKRDFPALRAYRYVSAHHTFFADTLPMRLAATAAGAPEAVFIDAAVDYNFPTFSWLAALAEARLEDDSSEDDSDFFFDEEDDDGGSASTDSDSNSDKTGYEGLDADGEDNWEIDSEGALMAYRREWVLD
ncbi:hypothetical protein C8F04DRAFT_1360982 [Mycena alexandri]|uniref:F-box domain-containing protein n=1 Tax=Mycena alexandri TaxID=1745969 RepID=A0AAD6SQ94_9AGAR|nr:hypothetical protein C8F04DRAFT_1360982 [Mycena alexandri]